VHQSGLRGRLEHEHLGDLRGKRGEGRTGGKRERKGCGREKWLAGMKEGEMVRRDGRGRKR
jgi:hypothetical protein